MNTAQLFTDKMKRENEPKVAIDTFLRFYDALTHGKNGCIAEDDIVPIADGELDELSLIGGQNDAAGIAALKSTVVIKLNGGLGTSMGLDEAKSLIPVKNNLSFLDITALQIRSMNKKFNLSIPLVMMNSFNTEKATLAALNLYDDIKTDIPFSFIQHKFPKVRADDLTPVSWTQNPQLEWNPPGHGDLYAAILTSGVLETLLEKNYKYAFISNIDNLGATLDTHILGYFASKNTPFLMEVTDRTHMDRKGGHIAKLKSGGLILREAAQCPNDSLNCFMNIRKYKFFNTNNLWIRLDALKEAWDKGTLELPMICNRKKMAENGETLDVIQLESAMGSAISVFENAAALRVPRSRFSPVKNCEDLLLLWSDYYDLTGDYRIVMNPRHKSIQMNMELDARYYKTLNRLKERFPRGVPSLADCTSLKVIGDVLFGKDIIITGKTTIVNPNDTQATIEDGQILCDEVVL